MKPQIPVNLKEKILNKQLVFTVTTGRSGTSYLTSLLSCIPSLTCHHEPKPSFHHSLRQIQSKPSLAYDFWIQEKLPAIADSPTNIYIETSHAFCKGSFEPLLDLGIVPDLILLQRPHRDVALSLYHLDWIPSQPTEWFLYPDDPTFLKLPNWRSMHEYQLCYWYCLEIERRAIAYSQCLLHTDSRVVRVTFNELTQGNGFSMIKKGLNLPNAGFIGSLRYLRRKKRKQNLRSDEKLKAAKVSLSLEELEALENEVDHITSQ